MKLYKQTLPAILRRPVKKGGEKFVCSGHEFISYASTPEARLEQAKNFFREALHAE